MKSRSSSVGVKSRSGSDSYTKKLDSFTKKPLSGESKYAKKAGKIYHKEELRKRRGSYSYDYTSYSVGGTARPRRSLHDERSSIHDEQEIDSREMVSPRTDEYAEGNLLICNFLVVIFAVDCLLVYILVNTPLNIGFTQNITQSHETSRAVMQILTDNLDCSLLAKEAGLKFKDVHYQMWVALYCLEKINTLTKNPKTKNPKTANKVPVSTMFYYVQGRQSLAHNYKSKMFTENCIKRVKPSLKCGLRSQYKMMRSYVGLHKALHWSPLYSVWMGKNLSQKEIKVLEEWMFDWGANGTRLKQTSGLLEGRKKFLRQFRRPKLSAKFMPFYTGYPNKTIIRNIIKLTNKSWVLPPKSSLTRFQQDIAHYCSLPLSNSKYELRFPCTNQTLTSSFVSAFIVRVVHEIMTNEPSPRGYMDSAFHALLVRAHLYIESQLLNDNAAQRWDAETGLPHFLSEEALATAVADISGTGTTQIHNITQGRQIFDRTWTAIIWQSKTGEDDVAVMTNFGTLVKAGFHVNISMNRTGSSHSENLFTSAAGLMVVEVEKTKSLRIVASASGSLRTIEAVASVVLRMLLFDEEPGAAISANATFYDFQDHTIYCETLDQRFLDELKSKGVEECRPVRWDYVAHLDRIAMAARRRPPNGRIVAAVDRRSPDFNYAAGF